MNNESYWSFKSSVLVTKKSLTVVQTFQNSKPNIKYESSISSESWEEIIRDSVSVSWSSAATLNVDPKKEEIAECRFIGIPFTYQSQHEPKSCGFSDFLWFSSSTRSS